MPSVLKTWKLVLLWLIRSQGLGYGAAFSKVPQRLLDLYPPPVSDELVRRELDSDVGSLGEPRNYLYLRCPERSQQLQPILAVKWTDDPRLCSLRIRLILCKEADASDRVEGFGFRFEAPEGPTGRHSFFHGQLIKLQNANPGSPAWLPDKEPTLPVAAVDEVQLVVVLAIALYGAEVLTRMGAEQSLDLCRAHIGEISTFLSRGASVMEQRQAKAEAEKKRKRKNR